MPPTNPSKAPGATKAAAKKSAAKKAAPAAHAKPSKVDDLVDDYLETATEALESYADLARRAGKRLAGERGSDAGSWADDAAKFWGFVARDQVSYLKLWNELMEVASKPLGKR